MEELFMKFDNPLVSIVIRNRNEAVFLKLVLESVSQQQFVKTEIILVDNESEDESVEIAKKYDAKILTIAKNDFTYGRALNIGMSAATGEICVLLSAHSMLVSPFALYSATLPFTDETIAAARFLHTGKRFDLKKWIEPEILESTADINAVISKAPLANGCAIRRKVWQEINFNEQIIAAEEKIWTLEALKKGYRIFSPCAAVYCYLKDLPLSAQIKKNNRELQAVFSETGFRAGHFKKPLSQRLKKLAVGMLKTPLVSVYRTAAKTLFELEFFIREKKKTKKMN